MRISTIIAATTLFAALTGPTLAQGTSGGAAGGTSATPENSASPAREADKMKAGDTAGSAPNSSNPGTSAGSDGNKTQDSRTTKTKDR
ncbi:hypothetical protein MKK50_06810 [Methylobacterium sp. J-043]|nr:hypothetical protein [Methylobacterium sp. J-043]